MLQIRHKRIRFPRGHVQGAWRGAPPSKAEVVHDAAGVAKGCGMDLLSRPQRAAKMPTVRIRGMGDVCRDLRRI